MKEISADLVRELLLYNPDTGEFFYKQKDQKWFRRKETCDSWNKKFAGKNCCHLKKRKNGYQCVIVRINKQAYYAHRLAWIYMTGRQPPKQIDHKNRNGTDNRWSNLRDGSKVNRFNLSLYQNNKSGVCGVHWDKHKKRWKATGYTNVNGRRRQKNLGQFKTKDEAAEVAINFRKSNGYESGHGEPRPLI